MNSKKESPSNKKNQESFAVAIEKSLSEQGQNYGKGRILEGRIIAVEESGIFVDIGLKSEGRIPRNEFTDLPEVGASVAVLVKGKEHESEVYLLSKTEADARKGWETVKESHKKDLQVQGRITSEVKGKGFNVNVEGLEFFLPASQLAYKFTNLDDLKSKLWDFKIIRLSEKGRTGVVSRKKLLDEVNQEKWGELINIVKKGDRVTGEISKVTDFGVFVNIHGVDGLLRQNDISYKKYAPFKQYFQVGQSIEVLVLEIDQENNRLSLGLKQLSEDPWEWAKRELEKGVIVRGTITSLTNFGAFVELKEGLEGLIHSSELSWAKKPPLPKDILKKGQEVDSIILDIDFEKRRLSLGRKQLEKNPWESLSSNVRVGNSLEGKITGITKYGAFVEVENGIEGLIHIGDITWDEKVKDPTTLLKKGQLVNYKILDINQQSNRISCGLKQLQENPYEV
ncbi:MAG: 30S ribosomal protein S1, partial [Leptospiraceae bacterium]|nr:30S ribosomal protein S1 [Leptospiraceae bacterium]